MRDEGHRLRRGNLLPQEERSWRLLYYEEVGSSLNRAFESEAVHAATTLDRIRERRWESIRRSTTTTLAFYAVAAGALAAFPETRGSAASLAVGAALLALGVAVVGLVTSARRRCAGRTPLGVRGIAALGGFEALPVVAARSLMRDTGGDERYDEEDGHDLERERLHILDAYHQWCRRNLPTEAAREIYRALLAECDGTLGELVETSRRLG